ncbi:MAG: hypothetical protein KC493_17015 [Bacteriovoracaceae bacterium]|nr:hypothetical protein [Bacteriovoracaceae bacterium]
MLIQAIDSCINESEILRHERLKAQYDTEKKRLELLRQKINSKENEFIERIDKGDILDSSRFKIEVTESIRRPVKWRAVVAEKLGLSYVESIIESATIKVSRSLLITQISNA